jgi:hypothetical protein
MRGPPKEAPMSPRYEQIWEAAKVDYERWVIEMAWRMIANAIRARRMLIPDGYRIEARGDERPLLRDREGRVLAMVERVPEWN